MACAVCGDKGEYFDDILLIKRSCISCKEGHPVSHNLAAAALYAVTPEPLGGAQEIMDAVAQENN